jgi:hypothetical protein
MAFFDLPAEIRLHIYSKILVCSDAFNLAIIYRPYMKIRRFSPKKPGVNPSILRVNKKIHRETSPVLYSENTFYLLLFADDVALRPDSPEMTGSANFFNQIGGQASLIRHVFINFPNFSNLENGEVEFNEITGKKLGLIRDACTGITTLHLTVPSGSVDRAMGKEVSASKALDLLEAYFKTMPTLKEVSVSISWQYNINPNLIADYADMSDRGWAVKVWVRPGISISDSQRALLGMN